MTPSADAADAEPDASAVLAWVVKKGLVPADTTVDDIHRLPPAWRAYKAEMALQARLKEAEERRARADAEAAERSAAADRAWRARRARRDAIRAWAAEHGWPVGAGRIPDSVQEAYRVAQEGGDGQAALF